MKPDGTPDDEDRVETGPTALAFREWQEAGLQPPNLPDMRAFRLRRLVAEIVRRDCAGVLLYDPLNVRYATDAPNMQIWAMHNPFRACFVGADGYVILFDYGGRSQFSAFNPLVDEVRKGASFFYFTHAQRAAEKAEGFADQIDDILRERYGRSRRLAIDKIMPHGLVALQARGLSIVDGEAITEHARKIKGPDEIRAMRCAIYACERAVDSMREQTVPGSSESDAWSVLHAENICRGGEWIETRLFCSGPRTNPWFQECGPRIIGENEIVSFDTDLIGPYGMCSDISRSWLVGDGRPTDEQRRLHEAAHQHIMANMELVRPGVSFEELTFGGNQLAEEFMANRYGVRFHGVGLCDEYPVIKHPVDYESDGFDGIVEPGMTLCVEAYIGVEGGAEGIKLENQVLVTESGYEDLTSYPFDERLMV